MQPLGGASHGSPVHGDLIALVALGEVAQVMLQIEDAEVSLAKVGHVDAERLQKRKARLVVQAHVVLDVHMPILVEERRRDGSA